MISKDHLDRLSQHFAAEIFDSHLNSRYCTLTGLVTELTADVCQYANLNLIVGRQSWGSGQHSRNYSSDKPRVDSFFH